MIIIIDGYNVLKSESASCNSTLQERSAFINYIGRYKKKRHHKIIIVFDAGPTDCVQKEKQHGVSLIFSGVKKSADDVIIEFVKNNAGKNVLVVTADNEIINQAVQNNIETALPAVFLKKVKEAFGDESVKKKSKSSGVIKLHSNQNNEVDALMYQASQMSNPFAKDDSVGYFKKEERVKKNKLSKKERKRAKKIDML